MSKEAYKEAMEELDALDKSQAAEETETLDELTKALEEELGEELAKSDDGDDDDEGGEPEPEDDGDDDTEKSQQQEFDDELIKASEAYASMESSVRHGIESIHCELDALRKGMAATMNLCIKQAKVIAQFAKSMPDLGEMAKSIQTLGGQPMAPNKAVLGIGSMDDPTEALQKSVSEVQDLLQKAVQDGKVDARYLSIYGTYKDINRLPVDVRDIIGL